MKKSIIAVLIGSSLVLPLQAQTLEEAVTQTLMTHPKVKEAYHLYQTRQYQQDEAVAGYYPTLDANAGIGYQYTNSPATRAAGATSEELTRKETGLSLRQLLFDGFKTSSNVHRTQAEADAQSYALLSNAENIALQVTEVYLDVLRQDEIVELSRRNLETHEQINSDIQRRTDSGIGSTADFTQIKGRVARSYSNMTAAENNLRDAQSQYIALVNQAPSDLRQPKADANFIPPSLDDALALAQERHPILTSAAFDVDAAHYQHRDAKSGFYPKVYIELGSHWDDDIDGVPGHRTDHTAMVRLRYNLFNGGADVARSRATSAQEMQAKDIKLNAHRQVDEGMRLSWAAYESLGRQKDFLRQHVEAGYNTVDAYKKQFSLGSRTLLDVLNTENELFEARRSYINAEYDQLLAEYRIMNASGQLLDAFRFTRPEQWQAKK